MEAPDPHGGWMPESDERATLSIGELARLTLLSVKALRHYHDVGVLVPAAVDPTTGYRRYALEQVPDALLVRRLRDLDLPLADVREVLSAADDGARDRVIVAHLDRLDRDLARTRLAIASLRDLLDHPAGAVPVDLRRVDAQPALACTEVVRREDTSAWCARTYPRLYEGLAEQGRHPVGPGGALYSTEFFELGEGPVTAYVPVALPPEPARGDQALVLPAGSFAVAVHEGPFEDLDRTYGALGTTVTGSLAGAPGAIRERYLVSPADTDDPDGLRTEILWPVQDPAPLER